MNPTAEQWENFRKNAPEQCPACGKDVVLSRSELEWACVDPDCRLAHPEPKYTDRQPSGPESRFLTREQRRVMKKGGSESRFKR